MPTSSTAVGKVEVYAAAVARLIPQTAPLREALRMAGETDADCAATWRRLVTRRAANMRLFAAELRSTGELRDDLTDEEVADLVWSTNAAEYWLLLVQRGWTPARYEVLLVNVESDAAHLNRAPPRCRRPGDGVESAWSSVSWFEAGLLSASNAVSRL